MDQYRLAILILNIFYMIILLSYLDLFRQFERAYNEIVEAVLPLISNTTGCYAPCSYKEYRFTGAATEAPVRQFSSFAIYLQ